MFDSNKAVCMIFHDKQFYVSAFTKVLMNILDAQEMINVQKFLLTVQIHPNYAFTNFDSALTGCLKTFSSSLFVMANKETKQEISKMMANTNNIITVKKDQPNSTIQLFAYTVFAIIFPTSNLQNGQAKTSINDSLLETLKCSMYSKDINFNQISSKQFSFDNLQAKAMIARFFSSLTKNQELSNLQRIKFIQWSLQTNSILYELFMRFYRIILIKIGIEEAENYYQSLGFDETVNNLIEYFDIHYRCSKQFFFISGDNYFLAQTKEFFVIGKYFQNQITKNDLNINNKNQAVSITNRASSPKRQGVIQNDVKLFNFILDSGIHEKENDIETPHFTDSNHQFAFGRKKKDDDQIIRQEQLKRQFQKLIMNSSTSSVQQNEHYKLVTDLSTLPMPFLGGQLAFTKGLEENKIPFLRKPTFHQSPIHQLSDQNFDNNNPKANPQSSRNKNIVSVKGKHSTTFSPQVTNSPRYENFSNLANDALFIEQENIECFKSSSGNIAQRAQPFLKGQCKCLQVRKMRNLIVSKVIDIINYPISRMKNYTSRSPKFINNLKLSENLGFRSPQIRVIPAKQKDEQNPNINNKQVRKPAFLKFLKKGKQKPQKYSASSHSLSKLKSKSKSRNNSIKGQSPANRDKSIRFQLDKQTLNKINNKIAKYSAIYNKQAHQNRFKQYSHSTSRKNQSSSAHKRVITEQGSSIKKFDSKYMNSRLGLGNNWKSSSNFHQPNRQRKHTDYIEYFQSKKRQTMKVYAPVNIIAPTVYFNGNHQRDNRVIFKVNDTSKDRQQNIQLKQSQRIPNNSQFLNNQKSLGFYSKRYT